ncbi:MAG TPA: fasciclin domain-containing protein [Trebonia sp.]|nr:fasciclin domain-containing protein [Trebonia sp.]
MKNLRLLAVSGLAASLAVSAAACSSSSPSSTPAAAPAASSPVATSSSATAAGTGSSASTMADFGPACSAVPKAGAGSFTGMATAPVATAASANPVLSTLVTAVKKAGLVDTLNAASGITVFAPDNSAFAKIPSATLNSVLANKGELTKILTYHVVAGRYTPAQLASGKALKTLEGGTVTTGLSGGTYTVNGADVVCGNVQTANATVYIINSVLMPRSSS